MRGILSIFVCSFSIITVLSALTLREFRKPPEVFALNDELAHYSIRSIADEYWLVYVKPTSHIEVHIGASPVDLDPYVGKFVDVKGKFSYAETRSKGRDLPRSKYVVLDIERISVR
jgi:hypothetical protein